MALPGDKGDQVNAVAWAPNIGRLYTFKFLLDLHILFGSLNFLRTTPLYWIMFSQIYFKWLNGSASSNNLVQVVFLPDAGKVLLIGRKISPCNSIFIDGFTGMVFFQTIWSNSCRYSKGHCHMAFRIGPWPRWKALSRESRVALQSRRRGINSIVLLFTLLSTSTNLMATGVIPWKYAILEAHVGVGQKYA